MNAINERQSEINGMRLHTITTDKFKTNTLVLMLKNILDEQTVTKRALIPYILQSGTKQYPTRKQLRLRLDDLYGANFHVDVQKKGEQHIIVFRLDIANEKYLKDTTPLLQHAIQFLAEVLLQPNLENDHFVKTIVNSEKRTLTQRIRSINDDKIRYANMRATEEMCQGEPYALTAYGKEEYIDAIDEKNLYEFYKQMLVEDEIDLYFVGAADEEEVTQIVKQSFQFPAERKENPEIRVAINNKEVQEERVVFEEQDVKQGKLNIGFRTYSTFKDDDYFPLQVFNGIFGGFSHSKLFLNVREKASLAYYAVSRYESHKGILMVMSGIEFANYNQAVSIIKEQLEAMKAGDFTDEEIEQTKSMIKNQLLETIDVPRALVELLYHNVVANTNRTIKEWMEGIDRVTRDDIMKVGKKIKLDTIYFLRGKEESAIE